MANSVELFTLRLWQEGPDDKTEWRGKIQHVRSGEARYFRDWYTLVDFLSEIVPKLEGSDLGSHNFPGGHGSSGQGSSDTKRARRVGKGRKKHIISHELFARWKEEAGMVNAQLVRRCRRATQTVVNRWRLALLSTQLWGMSLAASLILLLMPTSLAFVVVEI